MWCVNCGNNYSNLFRPVNVSPKTLWMHMECAALCCSLCWHLGNAKHGEVWMEAKAWGDNPCVFVPNVHNNLRTMVHQTAGGVTRESRTMAKTWEHCIGVQDAMQQQAQLLVVQPYSLHTWKFELSCRLQMFPFLLPENRRLKLVITHADRHVKFNSKGH